LRYWTFFFLHAFCLLFACAIPAYGVSELAVVSTSPVETAKTDLQRNRPDTTASLLLGLTVSEKTWLAAHPHIRIASMDAWPPMDFLDDDGSPAGIGVDYVRTLNKLLGGVLEIVPGPFKKSIEKVKAGELDALLDISPKPEREEYLYFTSPYLTIPHVIVAREDGPYYAAEADLRGKTIALEEGFFSIKYFQDNYNDIHIVEYPNTAMALDAVARGQADAYAGNRAVAIWIMEQEIISNLQVQGRLARKGSVLAIGIRKDWPELASILEKALAAIPRDEIQAIHRHWTGLSETKETENKTIKLTDNEHQFIKFHPPLRFSEVPWEPLSIIKDDGRFDGMIADYLAYITEVSGLQFTFQTSETWADVLDSYVKGKIDMIPALDKNDTIGREILFSKQFLTFPLVIVTRDNVSFIDHTEELNNKKVAVGRGYTSSHFLKNNYPAIELVETDDVDEALIKVARNNVFAFVGHLAVAVDAIQRLGLKNLKIAGETEYRFEHRIGIDPRYPEALSIINRAIDQISEEESRAIYHKWLEVEYAKGIDYSLVRQVVAWAAILLLLVLFWNQRLKGEIAKRKKVEMELIANERKIRAMADASHDAVIMINARGLVRFWNRSAEKMFEITAEEAYGKPMHDIFVAADHRDAISNGLQRFTETGTGPFIGNVVEHVAKRLDGSLFPVEIAISSFQLDEGWYAVGAIRDISERQRTQQERDNAFEIINSSISYARNIQGSVLPSTTVLDNTLGDYFILWEPRDRVGGDIYFCKPFGLGKIIALGDCTGHGVPGAFMTMIANGALEMALLETPPGEVGRLVTRTHQLIRDALVKEKEKEETDDGMELGICYLSHGNRQMLFSGARFSLFGVKNNEVTEIKGDRNGIGYHSLPATIQFTNHVVDTEGFSCFYLTTDGLLDQIGGKKRRAFGKRRFKRLLLDLEDLPMPDRRNRLIETLNNYQGPERRRDDVAVIGFVNPCKP